MGKITVFGSFVVDLMGRAPHLPIPGETVKGSLFQMGPGGKGFNQGVAAHKAGAQIYMVTKLGADDAFRNICLQAMHQLDMDSQYLLTAKGVDTGCALILVDEQTGKNEIVVVPGACDTISDEEVDTLSPLLDDSEFLLTQLETNISAISRILSAAEERDVRIILNPAPVQPLPEELLAKIDTITPNEVEAEILTGIAIVDDDAASLAADWFMDRGVKNVVLTLGERGVYLATPTDRRHIPSFPVNAIDTTGAGDAFNGGFVCALSEGKTMQEACVFANALAALSVQQLGTTPAMPSRDEIDTFLQERTSL